MIVNAIAEKRKRQFRPPRCGSVRIDETCVRIHGKRRFLYRAIDKHGKPIDFLLSAKRDLDAAKAFSSTIGTICSRAGSDFKRIAKHENATTHGVASTCCIVCDKPD